jgi:hypothetical protein
MEIMIIMDNFKLITNNKINLIKMMQTFFENIYNKNYKFL